MKVKRMIFLVTGCISLSLGCAGIVLPILPTVPFYLVTVCCFAQSSQKLHDWFIGTKMYQKHLASFMKKQGMSVRTKAWIISSVTLLMGIGFFVMERLSLCRWILIIIWTLHIIYFIFFVKTVHTDV
ncbi:hypothetical protein SDC9_120178 [bioreactor metagenome]|uniref:Inner membrane protein YbaN n=1 Tax=bioreactor metagenome TaxID=1076179 RepID=A0A645C6A0_9ZZZZ